MEMKSNNKYNEVIPDKMIIISNSASYFLTVRIVTSYPRIRAKIETDHADISVQRQKIHSIIL